MTVKGANRSTRRKKWPIATSSFKKSHVYWLGSNPGLPHCISYREVTFPGNIWGDFCWWFTWYICPCRWNYDLKCCSLLRWRYWSRATWTGGTGANVAGRGRELTFVPQESIFLCDSCRLTARDAMWETILSVWVDVEFRDPPPLLSRLDAAGLAQGCRKLYSAN
jgi:hypothetical protein